MVVSFSHSGRFLAVGGITVDTSSSHFTAAATIVSLKIYCPDSGIEVWADNSAHHGVIYEIKWSADDRFLLTCSGDGTCKVWDVRPISTKEHLGLLLATAHQLQQSGNSSAAG